MGANDDREMLVAAKAECVRLERENSELREQLEARESAHSKESEDWTHLAAGYQHQIAEAQATIDKVREAVAWRTDPNSTKADVLRILSAPSSTGGNDHDRAVVHEAAEAIRHHATAPTELVWPTVQIDRLLAWVADWIENPPEWVHVSYRDAVPAEPQQKEGE